MPIPEPKYNGTQIADGAELQFDLEELCSGIISGMI
jgi:hypothetical protein